MERGVIFDIQHFSTHDGPGVRSTVFFKGCPLHCPWCSNPESQKHVPQILRYAHLCRQCGNCVGACPEQALSVAAGRIECNGNCVACGACVEACPHHANVLSGRLVTVQDICDEVRENWRIFMQSGGGVTISGGEPLAQQPFLLRLLRELHSVLGFHTCIETSGFAPWPALEEILPELDMLFMDIKHMDPEAHRAKTGVSNDLILQNAARLGDRGFPLCIRVPLIPGYNDTPENLQKLGVFLLRHKLRKIELMPQHALGKSKYAALGRTYAIEENAPPRTQAAVHLLQGLGLEVETHQW